MNLRGVWDLIGIRPWRLVLLLLGFAIVLFVVLPLAAKATSPKTGSFKPYMDTWRK